MRSDANVGCSLPDDHSREPGRTAAVARLGRGNFHVNLAYGCDLINRARADWSCCPDRELPRCLPVKCSSTWRAGLPVIASDSLGGHRSVGGVLLAGRILRFRRSSARIQGLGTPRAAKKNGTAVAMPSRGPQ